MRIKVKKMISLLSAVMLVFSVICVDANARIVNSEQIVSPFEGVVFDNTDEWVNQFLDNETSGDVSNESHKKVLVFDEIKKFIGFDQLKKDFNDFLKNDIKNAIVVETGIADGLSAFFGADEALSAFDRGEINDDEVLYGIVIDVVNSTTSMGYLGYYKDKTINAYEKLVKNPLDEIHKFDVRLAAQMAQKKAVEEAKINDSKTVKKIEAIIMKAGDATEEKNEPQKEKQESKVVADGLKTGKTTTTCPAFLAASTDMDLGQILIDEIPEGSEVTILGGSNPCIKVNYRGQIGYMEYAVLESNIK